MVVTGDGPMRAYKRNNGFPHLNVFGEIRHDSWNANILDRFPLLSWTPQLGAQ
jgi:hypothetical protein